MKLDENHDVEKILKSLRTSQMHLEIGALLLQKEGGCEAVSSRGACIDVRIMI